MLIPESEAVTLTRDIVAVRIPAGDRFNLPAGTDIRRVREQLARMDRRLLQISKELEQLERARDAERV